MSGSSGSRSLPAASGPSGLIRIGDCNTDQFPELPGTGPRAWLQFTVWISLGPSSKSKPSAEAEPPFTHLGTRRTTRPGLGNVEKPRKKAARRLAAFCLRAGVEAHRGPDRRHCFKMTGERPYSTTSEDDRWVVRDQAGRAVVVCRDRANAEEYAALLNEAYNRGYKVGYREGRLSTNPRPSPRSPT